MRSKRRDRDASSNSRIRRFCSGVDSPVRSTSVSGTSASRTMNCTGWRSPSLVNPARRLGLRSNRVRMATDSRSASTRSAKSKDSWTV